MADPRYPMLRRRRRRRGMRLRLPAFTRARAVALGVLLLVLIAAAALVLRPQARTAPAQALADARTAFGLGNFSAARNHALAALAGDPASRPAMLLLARSYLRLGEGAAAEGTLARAGKLGEPAAALAGLQAQARLLQGDPQGALDRADQAAADDGDAVRARARATALGGDAGEGARLLTDWIAAHPDDALAVTDFGRIRLDAGELTGATQAAARAVRLAPGDPGPLTLQAEVVRTRYGLTAALPWFEAALQRDAYYTPALIGYAATLGELGRNADLLDAARAALAARPGHPQALYLQAALAARAGKPGLARAMLYHAGGALAATPGAMLLDGGADLQAGRYEGATGTWRRLAEAQPANLVVRRLLGDAMLRAGDPAGALDWLGPAIQRRDADAYTLTLAARAYEARGDRLTAGQLLDRAARGATDSAGGFASDDTVGTLRAAAAGDPGDPHALIEVIRGQLSAGDTAGAIAQARVLVTQSPGAPPAQLALGDTLAAAGRYAEAAPVYARAASLSFDEATMLRLVDAWGRAGRPEQAAAALSLFLEQNPQNLTAQGLRGRLQIETGEADAGIETLEAVRRIAGNRDAALLADLARGYAATDDGAIARRYARAAYALSPMNPGVCDAYALALAADGDLAGARQLATKALALAPGDPRIAAHARALAR